MLKRHLFDRLHAFSAALFLARPFFKKRTESRFLLAEALFLLISIKGKKQPLGRACRPSLPPFPAAPCPKTTVPPFLGKPEERARARLTGLPPTFCFCCSLQKLFGMHLGFYLAKTGKVGSCRLGNAFRMGGGGGLSLCCSPTQM